MSTPSEDTQSSDPGIQLPASISTHPDSEPTIPTQPSSTQSIDNLSTTAQPSQGETPAPSYHTPLPNSQPPSYGPALHAPRGEPLFPETTNDNWREQRTTRGHDPFGAPSGVSSFGTSGQNLFSDSSEEYYPPSGLFGDNAPTGTASFGAARPQGRQGDFQAYVDRYGYPGPPSGVPSYVERNPTRFVNGQYVPPPWDRPGFSGILPPQYPWVEGMFPRYTPRFVSNHSTTFGAPSAQGSSLFGNPSTQDSSLFGGPSTQASPIFGASSAQDSSLFGGPSTQAPTNHHPSQWTMPFRPVRGQGLFNGAVGSESTLRARYNACKVAWEAETSTCRNDLLRTLDLIPEETKKSIKVATAINLGHPREDFNLMRLILFLEIVSHLARFAAEEILVIFQESETKIPDQSARDFLRSLGLKTRLVGGGWKWNRRALATDGAGGTKTFFFQGRIQDVHPDFKDFLPSMAELGLPLTLRPRGLALHKYLGVEYVLQRLAQPLEPDERLVVTEILEATAARLKLESQIDEQYRKVQLSDDGAQFHYLSREVLSWKK